MKLLEALAKLCAVIAGVLLTVITLMTCVSLIGRNTTGWTIVGDFELSGSAAGAAIALFMPWCQVKRGNIMVDFFTSGASAATQDRLDRFGALLFAGVMALMTWRTAIGGLSAWTSKSGSMMLGFPEWVVYAGMVPPMAVRQVISTITAANSKAPKRSSAACAPAEAPAVKKSTMMLPRRTWHQGRKSAIAAPAAAPESSKSPTMVQPVVLRPIRLTQVISVITVSRQPAMTAQTRASRASRFKAGSLSLNTGSPAGGRRGRRSRRRRRSGTTAGSSARAARR